MFGIDTELSGLKDFLGMFKGLLASASQFWTLQKTHGLWGALQLIGKNSANQFVEDTKEWIDSAKGNVREIQVMATTTVQEGAALISQISGKSPVAETGQLTPPPTPSGQKESPQNSPA